LCLLVGIGAAAALLLIAVRALTVAASDNAEATDAVVESFELGEAPAKRKKA
jgi:valine--tRNA ligase